MALTVGTNTYVDEAFLTAYCADYGLDTPVDAEASLKQATAALDRIYGGRYLGVRKQNIDLQPLAWPRLVAAAPVEAINGTLFVDAFGTLRDFNLVPIEVKQATCELAVLIEGGVDPYIQPNPRLTQERVKVDVIETQQVFSGTGYATDPLYKISTLLAPLLAQPSIKLVR